MMCVPFKVVSAIWAIISTDFADEDPIQDVDIHIVDLFLTPLSYSLHSLSSFRHPLLSHFDPRQQNHPPKPS